MRSSRSSRASWRGAEHHERIPDRPRLSVGTDRGFGLAVALLLTVLDAAVYWRTGQFNWWMIAAAGALVAGALGAPSVLSPLNRAWVGLRQMLSRGAAVALLAVIYWVAIVPAGVIMRLGGRNRLALGFDKKAGTYWSARLAEGVDLKNQH